MSHHASVRHPGVNQSGAFPLAWDIGPPPANLVPDACPVVTDEVAEYVVSCHRAYFLDEPEPLQFEQPKVVARREFEHAHMWLMSFRDIYERQWFVYVGLELRGGERTQTRWFYAQLNSQQLTPDEALQIEYADFVRSKH